MIDQDLIDILLEAMQDPKQRVKWREAYSNCINRATEKSYNGRNAFYLSMLQYKHWFTTNQWITFNQCKELWWKIKKWSKSATIIYFTFKEKEWQEDKDDDDKKYSPIVKYYRVFNLDQVEWIEALAFEANDHLPSDERWSTPINRYIQAFDTLAISHWPGNYYCPPEDKITLVNPIHRKSLESYHHTMYHEVIHSTGHKDRLNRKEVAWVIKFWSHDYSVEELVAEFWSCMLSSMLWVPIDYNNSWAYLWSRAKKIKAESKEREVQWAIARASKATEYVLSFSK